MKRNETRIRRGLKTKAIIKNSARTRLVVYRSLKHIYAQIVVRSANGDKVLVTCSTNDKELKPTLSGNKVEQASEVGKLLGKRAREASITDVAFDRNGYKYHGRVKALADGAREAGLDF